jgi:hypothetical protein
MSNTMKKVILTLFLSLVTLLLVYRSIQCWLIEEYSPNWKSSSISEAKKNNVFINEVGVTPRQITIDGKKVELRECWVEAQSLVRYEYLLFKKRTLLNNYYLCFTINNPKRVDFDFQYEFWEKGSDYGIHDGTINLFATKLKNKNVKELFIGIFEHTNMSSSEVKEKMPPIIKLTFK